MAADEQLSIDYIQVLADLRARRDQLDTAIKAIEAIVGGTGVVRSAQAAPTTIQPGMFLSHTIADAARKVFEIYKRNLKTKEIVDALVAGGFHFSTDTPLNTVQTVLGRQSDIVKIDRGTWGLASWHPNSSRFKRKRVRIDDDQGGEAEIEGVSEPELEASSERSHVERRRLIEQTPDLKVVE